MMYVVMEAAVCVLLTLAVGTLLFALGLVFILLQEGFYALKTFAGRYLRPAGIGSRKTGVSLRASLQVNSGDRLYHTVNS
jgi:hypothetical protein